ncbi:HEAT repeat domain-containing protein [Vreelandella aquamarina]|uniref:HEAT repeat domain-containing protein n=1 Tax=Vreelandella aquamarina TaxID=77097 RepID=UPI00384DEF3F
MALKRSNSDQALPSRKGREHARDSASLLQELHAAEAPIRRWAARDLSHFPETVNDLLNALRAEEDESVCEALFCSLEHIAHTHSDSEAAMEVTQGLLELLRSEKANVRNQAIDVLQTLPEQVAPHVERLLNDSDADVRIFALDILRALPHQNAPQWITQVLLQESHPNVLGAAVDRATEFGTAEMVPALERLQAGNNIPAYLRFAIKIALERIETDGSQGR